MTVRIGNAGPSGQQQGCREQWSRVSFADSEHIAGRRLFSPRWLVWWFAPQSGLKPKS